ncbi:hypothetical protein LVD15_22250 [Fulvivirga maritima]|uniref:hypothetical protein n=1 Tax=Fulvivirga maritima TaxID=2904247 RepID=UPI001F272A5F|nr:hypothetical protein [Fulvivirga maritima]UII25997.1 hypothetical protein LVD15_22250 [Fulvivirga maritima]
MDAVIEKRSIQDAISIIEERNGLNVEKENIRAIAYIKCHDFDISRSMPPFGYKVILLIGDLDIASFENNEWITLRYTESGVLVHYLFSCDFVPAEIRFLYKYLMN